MPFRSLASGNLNRLVTAGPPLKRPAVHHQDTNSVSLSTPSHTMSVDTSCDIAVSAGGEPVHACAFNPFEHRSLLAFGGLTLSVAAVHIEYETKSLSLERTIDIHHGTRILDVKWLPRETAILRYC